MTHQGVSATAHPAKARTHHWRHLPWWSKPVRRLECLDVCEVVITAPRPTLRGICRGRLRCRRGCGGHRCGWQRMLGRRTRQDLLQSRVDSRCSVSARNRGWCGRGWCALRRRLAWRLPRHCHLRFTGRVRHWCLWLSLSGHCVGLSGRRCRTWPFWLCPGGSYNVGLPRWLRSAGGYGNTLAILLRPLRRWVGLSLVRLLVGLRSARTPSSLRASPTRPPSTATTAAFGRHPLTSRTCTAAASTS